MGVRVWVALAVYVGLLATLGTSLYAPDVTGRNDGTLMAVLVLAAHVGIGVAVARWWVLIVPVAFGFVAFLLSEDDLATLLALIVAVPGALLATALGWLAGQRLGRDALPVAAAVFAVAVVPVAWAGAETIKRSNAPHLPAAVQRQLPIEESLASDCEKEAASNPRMEARVRVLVRELERNPDALVTYTYYYADGPEPEPRDITVRELAQEVLVDLEANPGCRTELRRQIEDALDS